MAAEQMADNRPPPRRSRWIGTPGIPWYRDRAILRLIAQIVFAVLFIGSIVFAINNLIQNVEESSLSLDFNVYERPFGPDVSEGIPLNTEWTWVEDSSRILSSPLWYIWAFIWIVLVLYVASRNSQKEWSRDVGVKLGIVVVGLILLYAQSLIFKALDDEIHSIFIEPLQPYLQPRTNTRALITGFINTIRVVVVSLVACTILGIFAGIGLLSNNYLVRVVASVYVEVFRNTPLLVQLFFIYLGMVSILDAPGEPGSIESPNSILGFDLSEKIYFINARGFYFPKPVATDSTMIFFIAVLLGLVVWWVIRKWRQDLQDNTGVPAYTLRYALPAFLVFAVGGWIAASIASDQGTPFTLDYPALLQGRSNVEGGQRINIAFFALFGGLTLYTGAFIADIVRAGIQAVSYGQIEAARAHGLKNSQVLNLVVLPQALRLIVPPLGNQYVNMGKNSSLGTAVTYADTYALTQIANNESGQAVPFFVGLMVTYLSLSLVLSVFTNWLNTATKLKSR